MKRLKIWLISALMLLGVSVAQEISVSEQIDRLLLEAPYADQEIIVKLNDEVTARSLFRDIEVVEFEDLGNQFCKIRIGEDMKEVLALLLADPSVLYAEPNYIVRICQEPNDPKFSDLWGMKKIGAPKTWDKYTDASKVIVAVIDTGVDYNHPDLKDNIWVNQAEKDGQTGVDDDNNGYVDDIHGWNGAANNGDPMDDHNHGTHCSGTIAAKGNNDIGVAGVCWTGKVMGCKFLKADGSGTTADAIKCIDYAVANGAKVLSNSWGGGGFSEALYDAIKAAGEKGVLFVAAAGNSYSDKLSFPAKYCEDNSSNGKSFPALDNVLSVAASTQDDSKASFSQYSKKANSEGNMIVAPGYEILSTVRNNGYDTFSGTSMATPHVAGVATLVLAQHPGWTYKQLKDTLVKKGDTIEWTIGWWEKMNVQRLNIGNILK